MRLATEFLKLPLCFDHERLLEEVNALSADEWLPHPTKFKGNSSVPLISVDGARNDDFSGSMLPTPALQQCEYIRQILAKFDSVLGRSRLMRLEGRCEVPEHSDINYHWYNRVRIHIPIITDPSVRFICNKKEINMRPGETWIFDTWKLHQVINEADITRIHLVIDTSGSAKFWDLAARGYDPFGSAATIEESKFVPYQPGQQAVIRTERYNTPEVMAPGELDALCGDLLADLELASIDDRQAVQRFILAVNHFRQDWRQTWLEHGNDLTGRQHFQKLVNQLRSTLSSIPPLWLASNQTDAANTLDARVLVAAVATGAPNQQFTEYYNTPASNNVAANGHAAGAGPRARKVGRNEPCPCGSGKKYKRCHG